MLAKTAALVQAAAPRCSAAVAAAGTAVVLAERTWDNPLWGDMPLTQPPSQLLQVPQLPAL
eukprot:CAMPEP_0171148334 /NCGR_PEP_ID=MMETSP0766_2-20121228/148516_1 /TAXON_ID=439317 /ORGANISM="Gambierdiscus australes, Strain CAWD 149" /LENGTH=60 /DNA_ID=CAMNT_0011612245 /DNA_START=419 /DNA_END=601 /DNA_ORIENTATION=+